MLAPVWAITVLSRLLGLSAEQTSFFNQLVGAVALPIAITVGSLALVNLFLNDLALGLQIALVALLALASLVGATALYMIALRHTRRVILRVVSNWGLVDFVSWGGLVLLFPTVGFAAVSAFLVHHDLMGVSGADPTDSTLSFSMFGTYIWNLADAVPLLEIPTTLNWKPVAEFTTGAGGALVLSYKVMLIVPLLQLAALVLQRQFGEPSRGGDIRVDVPRTSAEQRGTG
jgi:hypothetical protein